MFMPAWVNFKFAVLFSQFRSATWGNESDFKRQGAQLHFDFEKNEIK
jgi:hypothetical protein